MKRIILAALSVIIPSALLFACVVFLPPSEEKAGTAIKAEAETAGTESSIVQTEKTGEKSEDNAEEDGEMIGVWVPCMSYDLSGTDRSEKSWTKKVRRIMTDIKELGANTVVFHVRPFSDAIYPSELYPMSHTVAGIQGAGMDYDPLEIAVAEAHSAGLSFHAWINPLRVSTESQPPTLAPDSTISSWLSSEDSSRVFEWDGWKYLDPSYPEVRQLICDGVRELVSRYDVDGIHIDDYFYPTKDKGIDREEYAAYKKSAGDGALSLMKWRTANIDSLVCGMYSAAHSREGCVFGIAPQCNVDNDNDMCADVKLWSSRTGFCDYICPQTYVSEQHPIMPFGDFAQQWTDMVTAEGVKLYFGLGVYKAGTDADSGSWLTRSDNLATQNELVRKLGADGIMLFSYDYLNKEETKEEVGNLRKLIADSR